MDENTCAGVCCSWYPNYAHETAFDKGDGHKKLAGKELSVKLSYCATSHVITVSFDESCFHNIHLADGFDTAFKRLAEILSQKMNVHVEINSYSCEELHSTKGYYLPKKEEANG